MSRTKTNLVSKHERKLSIEAGTLYVVATPIGHRDDLSPRAGQILAKVDCIAAEDTRHSGTLLRQLGINTQPLSLHEHNEVERIDDIIATLENGQSVAVISDAGTPLISDPGFKLVRAAHARAIPVRAIPGPSAPIAALSVAGLPSDRFYFEGFLPARPTARRTRLQQLADCPTTLIFFESSHRIVASIGDLANCFGTQRPAAIARELTKRFEQTQNAPLGQLLEWLTAEPNHQRGEFVIVVAGAEPNTDLDANDKQILETLLEELPVKQAARLAAKITGRSQRDLYQLALTLAPEPTHR